MKDVCKRLELLEQQQAARPVYFSFTDRQGHARRVTAKELENIVSNQYKFLSLELRGKGHTMPPEAHALSLETCYDLRHTILDVLKSIKDKITQHWLWFAYFNLKTICTGFNYRGKAPDGLTHVYYPIWGGTLLIELTGDYAGDIFLDILTEYFTGDLTNIEIVSIKYTNDDGEVVIDERFDEGVT